MPIYDRKCDNCGKELIDVLEPVVTSAYACNCGGLLNRVWLPGQKANGVIGDECDIYIKHGICNEDGSPRRYRSKAEIARVAKEKGWVNRVRHMGLRGSDKSPHTSRWV